jgi:hypothetical protein
VRMGPDVMVFAVVAALVTLVFWMLTDAVI